MSSPRRFLHLALNLGIRRRKIGHFILGCMMGAFCDGTRTTRKRLNLFYLLSEHTLTLVRDICHLLAYAFTLLLPIGSKIKEVSSDWLNG